MRKVFFVFPGQGSQYRGMGSDLVELFGPAREVFSRASEVVGYDMAELCFRDPQDRLNVTRFTQPALLTHQIACLESFRSLMEERVAPCLAAGHSLGEYAALVAAGGLSFEDALRLVSSRGALMSELGTGGMLATTLDLATATALADKHYCGVSGCNLPDQTVIAGEDNDLDALTAELSAVHPKKRAVRLNTEGAFHSYLMVNAAREYRAVLENVEFAELRVPVLSNYTGALHEPASDTIRSRLFFQIFHPVRWVDCMDRAVDAGIDAVIEFGGGVGKAEGPEDKRPNLEGIVKKSLKRREHEAYYFAAINAESIRSTAAQLLGN